MRNLTPLLVILCCGVFMYGCHQQPAKQQAVATPVASLPVQKDTVTQGVRFDSSESVKANLSEGWIYYFTIENRQFRVRYDSIAGDMVAEYNEAGKWRSNVTLEMRDDFELVDQNYDGYADLYSQYGGQNFVNFYLPGKKLFSEQYRQPGDSETLLDSANGLYINFREPWHICNDYVSQLLDYKKTVPNVHFLLTGETYRVDGDCIIDSIRVLNLWQYDDVKDKATLLKTFAPKSPKEFDYAAFWKEHYRELMGLK